MKHLVLLKFKESCNKENVLDYSRDTFSKILESLEGISNVRIFSNCFVRDSNMDIMIEMKLKDEKVLIEYLKHELHLKFANTLIDHLISKVSFDYNDE